ncbi:MAG: tRNA 2-selenouridine(34) synthase MnmH [Lewinellaceae bacterium]|nr:tRNA 2-selenouridine(34) synthase MnmH [Lewinellaceae bacterium]
MKEITIEKFLADTERPVLLDVRTPAEYGQGHIPGSKNLPLFSNEERAEVGTLYKQISPEKAYLRGLDLAGAKLSWYLREAYRLAPGKRAAVHCWRGGKRSASLGALLEFSGFEVSVLVGGYKAYRHFVLDVFEKTPACFVVLGGKTGSGKTEILQRLAAQGEQVLDLEKLARHKGSAFGALGELPQPTSEQFENNLYQDFSKLTPHRRIWVENESRSIGKVFVPQGIWNKMRTAPLVQVELPFQHRVERLIADYAHFPKEELEESLRKIEKRMGGQHMKAALEAFQNGDIATSTGIALEYYDKSYTHATAKGHFSKSILLKPHELDCEKIASELIHIANDNGL